MVGPLCDGTAFAPSSDSTLGCVGCTAKAISPPAKRQGNAGSFDIHVIFSFTLWRTWQDSEACKDMQPETPFQKQFLFVGATLPDKVMTCSLLTQNVCNVAPT